MTPDGNSMNTRAMNHADITYPTRVPEGSRSKAKMGKKALANPIPITKENPIKSMT
jgi:hypothetical protein